MSSTRCLLWAGALLALWRGVDAANWAQASGYLEQNVAIPAIPSTSVPHWQARYGMVIITTSQTANSPAGILYLLGEMRMWYMWMILYFRRAFLDFMLAYLDLDRKINCLW
jgi:hypothetical protein